MDTLERKLAEIYATDEADWRRSVTIGLERGWIRHGAPGRKADRLKLLETKTRATGKRRARRGRKN